MKSSNNNKVIAVLILLLVVLVIDLTMSIYHITNYNAQKESGNARWQQVEQRIISLEDKIKILELKK